MALGDQNGRALMKKDFHTIYVQYKKIKIQLFYEILLIEQIKSFRVEKRKLKLKVLDKF